MEEESNFSKEREETILHTYKKDLTSHLQEAQGKVLKSILKEQRKKEEEKKLKSIKGENLVFLFVGFIFIFLSLLTIFFVFFKKEKTHYSLSENNFFQEELEINLSETSFSQALEIIHQNLKKPLTSPFLISFIETKNFFLPSGELKKEKQKINLTTFFNFFNISSPETFLKSINNFKVGIFNCYQEENKILTNSLIQQGNEEENNELTNLEAVQEDNLVKEQTENFLSEKICEKTYQNQIFFIFFTHQFNNTFRSTLLWERNMLLSLNQFLNLGIDNSSLFTKEFEDDYIFNNPVRILKNEKGETILVYGFWGNTLILTSDKKVFKEILQKIQ